MMNQSISVHKAIYNYNDPEERLEIVDIKIDKEFVENKEVASVFKEDAVLYDFHKEAVTSIKEDDRITSLRIILSKWSYIMTEYRLDNGEISPGFFEEEVTKEQARILYKLTEIKVFI